MALFTDGLLYGLVIPLTPNSPAKINEPWMLGMMYGGYALGVMIATPLFGILSDRIGRRKPMLVGVGVQILAVFTFATATYFPEILLARMAQGAAAAATWTTGLALVAERFHKNRARMMGIVMLGNTCGLVLGPLMGGFLFDWYGYRFPFWIAGLLLIFDGILRWGLIVDLPKNHTNPSELGLLLRDRTVLAASAVVVLGAWCWSVLEALLPHHLKYSADESPTSVGIIFTLGTIIYGISCPVAGAVTDRYGTWRTMIVGLVLMSLILPLLAVPKSIVGAGILLALINVAYGFAMNPTLTQLAAAVDRRGSSAYASVYSIYNMAYSIGMMGSDTTAGVLASFFSLQTALFLIGFMMLLFLPLAYFLYIKTGGQPDFTRASSYS